MSNNLSEYQIPTSEFSSNSNVSVIVDQINDIYNTQQQPVDAFIYGIKPETISDIKSPEVINPVSARLYIISTSIKEARDNYLKAA